MRNRTFRGSKYLSTNYLVNTERKVVTSQCSNFTEHNLNQGVSYQREQDKPSTVMHLGHSTMPVNSLPKTYVLNPITRKHQTNLNRGIPYRITDLLFKISRLRKAKTEELF